MLSFHNMATHVALAFYLAIGFHPATLRADDANALAQALTFHAGFDGDVDAAFAAGDGRLYTTDEKRENLQVGLRTSDVHLAAGRGRYGDALEFRRKSTDVVLFRAEKNIEYHKRSWSGAVALWLSLDPDHDLEPGYADPIQITDKTWNDAAFFVDFTKDDHPRQFRLGAFSDMSVWNPERIPWEEFPVEQRPMVVERRPPFGHGKWTHVCFTWNDFNVDGDAATAGLYINGEHTGDLPRERRQFTWNQDQAVIMLGLSYIGLLDDLLIFNRDLTAEEVRRLYELPKGGRSLHESN